MFVLLGDVVKIQPTTKWVSTLCQTQCIGDSPTFLAVVRYFVKKLLLMKNNKKNIILFLNLITIDTTIGMYYESKKKKLLSTNTKVSHGYLTKRINVAHSCNESYYYCYIKDNKFEIWYCGLKPFLEM